MKRLLKWYKAQALETQFRYGRWAYLIFGLCVGAMLFSGVAIASTIMDQGAPGKYGAWVVGGTAADGTAIAGAAKPVIIGGTDGTNVQILSVDSTGALVTAGTSTGTMPIAVPSKVSLSANVSGSICSLTPEAYYRISCGAAATWRQGAATPTAPTAVTTDNDLPANVLEDTQMDGDDTCIAFISASAVDCKVSRLGPAP